MVGLMSITSTTWARWVWVRGDHVRGDCQQVRVEFEKALTQHLIELAHIELVYDGQALTCQSVTCARARLATASGVLALLGESTCLSRGLQYTLKAISLREDQAPLIYKKSINLTQKHDVAEAGYQLARRVIRGPKLPETVSAQTQPMVWGIALGTVRAQRGWYGDYGTYFNLSGFKSISSLSHLEVRVGLSNSAIHNTTVDLSTLGIDVGLKYSPLSTGLDLWLSAGIMGAYQSWSMIERNIKPLDEQSLLWGSARKQNQGQAFGIAPWMEAGWIWSSGRLQPYLALRYVPLGFPTDQKWAEVSFLFGLRWR